MISGSTHEKAHEISVYNITSNPTTEWDTTICITEGKLTCWHNFTLVQPVLVVCIWGLHGVGLSLKCETEITEPSTTTSTTPNLTSTVIIKDKKTTPPPPPPFFKLGHM